MTVIDVYETENSVYEIDLEAKQYRRTPRGEPKPVESHRLTYGEWMALADTPEPVQIVPWLDGSEVLHILASDSTVGIFTSALTYTYERMRTADDD